MPLDAQHSNAWPAGLMSRVLFAFRDEFRQQPAPRSCSTEGGGVLSRTTIFVRGAIRAATKTCKYVSSSCTFFADVNHLSPSMLFTTTSRAAFVVGGKLTEAYSRVPRRYSANLNNRLQIWIRRRTKYNRGIYTWSIQQVSFEMRFNIINCRPIS